MRIWIERKILSDSSPVFDVIVGEDRAKIVSPESRRLESFSTLEEVAEAIISCVAWYSLPTPCLQARKLPPTPRPSSAPFPATSTRPGFAAPPRPPSGRVRRLVSPESKLGGPPSARAPDTENCSAIE